MKSRIWATTTGKLVAMTAAIGLAAIASAGEEKHAKIAIAVDHGDGPVHVNLDSAQLGFNLHDMQEGENQAIVDEQGRTILITREADGFRFDVDDKSIKMPLLNGDHESMMKIHSEHDENVEVHVVKIDGDHDGNHDGEHAVKIVKKVEVISE